MDVVKHCVLQVDLEDYLGVLLVEFFTNFSSENAQKTMMFLTKF